MSLSTFYSTYSGFDPATAQTYPDGTVITRNADGFDPAPRGTPDTGFSIDKLGQGGDGHIVV